MTGELFSLSLSLFSFVIRQKLISLFFLLLFLLLFGWLCLGFACCVYHDREYQKNNTNSLRNFLFYRNIMLCCCLGLFSYIFLQKAFPPFLLKHTQKELRYFFFRFEQKNRDWIAPRNGEIFQWVDALGRLWTLYLLSLIIHKLMTLHCRGSLRCSFLYLSDIYFSGQIDFPPLFFSTRCALFFLTRIWIFENLLLREFSDKFLRWSKFFFFLFTIAMFWFNKKSIEALFFCSDSSSMNELLWSYWTDKEPRLPFFFRIIIFLLIFFLMFSTAANLSVQLGEICDFDVMLFFYCNYWINKKNYGLCTIKFADLIWLLLTGCTGPPFSLMRSFNINFLYLFLPKTKNLVLQRECRQAWN